MACRPLHCTIIPICCAVVLAGQALSFVGVINEFLKMYSVSCVEPLKPFHNDGNCGGI